MQLLPRALIIALIVFSSSGLYAQTKPPVLKPGQKAPLIKVAEWVKGKPVVGFEKGKYYVVEFWATWCAPCITVMPHLSKLAQQYKGRVDFIGVSVREQGDDIPKLVRVFVEKQGDKMAYNVARDTPDDTMFNSWMTASGKAGIPASFLVDGEGIVLWIGHPLDLDPILAQATAGKLDRTAVLQSYEKELELNSLLAECADSTEKVFALIHANKSTEALTLIDRLDSRIRKEAPQDHLYPVRFKSLRLAVRHKQDPLGAEKEIKEKIGSPEGNFIAFDIMEFASKPGGDPTFGLRLARKMRQVLKVDGKAWVNWMNLGRYSEMLGDTPSATLQDYENAKIALAANTNLDSSMGELRERFNKDIDEGIARCKKKISDKAR